MDIDDKLIQAVLKISNARYFKKYSMANEEHYSEPDIRIVCESFLALAEAMLEEKK